MKTNKAIAVILGIWVAVWLVMSWATPEWKRKLLADTYVFSHRDIVSHRTDGAPAPSVKGKGRAQ